MKRQRQNNGLNVLSLFDGISCGRVALDRAGIKVKNYYSSEIDKSAIRVSEDNHSDIIRLGDVRELNADNLPSEGIDVLIGGSPCQSFSFAGKGVGMVTKENVDILDIEHYLQLKRDGFEFSGQSYLFWEYVRIMKLVKPKFFLLENVVMSKKWENVLSETVGVRPVKLNSILTSAQNRVRLYWANFHIPQPYDMGIKLGDILERKEYGMNNKASIVGRRLDVNGKRKDYNKSIPVIQYIEVRGNNRDKSNCITTVAKDTVLTSLPIGRHSGAYTNKLPYREYTKTERCRLMNLPDNYCDTLSNSGTVKATGNGWDVGMITHIFKCMMQHNE